MDLCKQNISEKELPGKISTMETNAKGEAGKNYLWLKLVHFQSNSHVQFKKSTRYYTIYSTDPSQFKVANEAPI